MAVHGHSVDDYLETIYFLAFPIGEYGPVVRDQPALSARVAEMLGVSRPSVSEMMKKLEHDGLVERGERKEAILTFTDDMVERIAERLGHPERCPHGWPVDPDREREENLELRPLSEVAAGESATIIRLAEHDGELLNWFYDQGLVPGTHVEVSGGMSGGDLRLMVEGKPKVASERAAAGLYVRPA
jgi:DtxR family transcriptional regulator, Mn-dependent transcriptional regulator